MIKGHFGLLHLLQATLDNSRETDHAILEVWGFGCQSFDASRNKHRHRRRFGSLHMLLVSYTKQFKATCKAE